MQLEMIESRSIPIYVCACHIIALENVSFECCQMERNDAFFHGSLSYDNDHINSYHS